MVSRVVSTLWNPEHKGILIYMAATGKVLSEGHIYQTISVMVTDNWLVARRFFNFVLLANYISVK